MKNQYLNRHGSGHRFFGFGAVLGINTQRVSWAYLVDIGRKWGYARRSYTILAFLRSISPRTHSIQAPFLRSYISQITINMPLTLSRHILEPPYTKARPNRRESTEEQTYVPIAIFPGPHHIPTDMILSSPASAEVSLAT